MLQNNVEAKRRANHRLHNVWELSFDWKYCNSLPFIKKKLNYMHDDKPSTGKWHLCESPLSTHIAQQNIIFNLYDQLKQT